MDKRPTIIDVARHAGGKSTVALVLQNSSLLKVKRAPRSRSRSNFWAMFIIAQPPNCGVPVLG